MFRFVSGRCKITEGIVHVTHEQPASGHAAGDEIMVGGQNFKIDYFYLTPGYRQTISHITTESLGLAFIGPRRQDSERVGVLRECEPKGSIGSGS